MKNSKMCLALFSGSIDKLTAAGIIISGAVANDMTIDVYVLLQGARAMLKDIARDKDKLSMAENANLRDEFLKSCKELNVKEWHEFFKEAKEIGDVKFHICGLAGKIWGGYKMEDFVEFADDIVGISEYISAAQEADVHLFI